MFRRWRLPLLTSAFVTAFDNDQPQCCGIIGILSKTNQIPDKLQAPKNYTVQELLCSGIQLMKNRGYDSAGIATLTNKPEAQFNLVKFADEQSGSSLNCINRVVSHVLKEFHGSTTGIGHTRWATCGLRINQNAHPHFSEDKSIMLVHNGIIGQYEGVKFNQLSHCKFTSQTDTEVAVHMLKELKKTGKTMLQALQELWRIFPSDSQWGLVILDRQNLNAIYTSTKGSPILIGFSANCEQVYVASQIIAFQNYADCYFDTRDGENFEITLQNAASIKESVKDRLVSIKSNSLALKDPPPPFKSFFSYEIREQGVLKFEPDMEKLKQMHFGQYFSMICCGSSFYAAGACQRLFKTLKAFKKINVYDPVEMSCDDIIDDQTVLMISQSGETKDLILMVDELKKKQKVKLIGIINVEGSLLARKVDYPIYIKVGRQVSVGATKSMYFQALHIAFFATYVAEAKKSVPIQMIKEIRAQLLDYPRLTRDTIQAVEESCKDLAKILTKYNSLFLLAMREALWIAREAALKLKELPYIHAEALGACQMKHGPIALIDSDNLHHSAVILFILNNDTFEKLVNAMDQMHSRKAYVVVITNCPEKCNAVFNEQLKKDPHAMPKYNFMIKVPEVKHFQHLLTVLPCQILVEHIVQLRGINPDMPRNLAKTVTV